MKLIRILVVIGVLSIGSCGGGSAHMKSPTGSVPVNSESGHSAAPVKSFELPPSGSESINPQESATQKRKIIYTAQVSLVVPDFSETESQILAQVARFGGYVAESNVDRTRGTQRAGKWVVRIPTAEFEPFLDAIVDIGVPETRHSNAQDVSEEYVDLEARIKSKHEVERRVLKLLEDRAGNIKDVITVEGELGRVREEIERMEGRLRFLSDKTALTTVTINAREQQNYVPPQAPTFTAEIAATWNQSLQVLTGFGRGLTLIVVGLAPWIPLITLVVAPCVWFIVRSRRRATGQPIQLQATIR